MIIYDQLRISDDGKTIYIDAHVNKSEQFANVYLDSITIVPAMDSQGKLLISETSPEIPTENYIYKDFFTGSIKEAHLTLSQTEFDAAFNNTDNEGEPISDGATAKMPFNGSFGNNLYFVYIKYKGIPDECVPCCLKSDYTLGVTFDEALLYQKVMQFTKELADNCTVSKGFIDMILLWYGFKASIETEHYIEAIDFWKKMFFGHHGVEGLSTYKPCGCHG
jgi:hypothetical protein